MDAPNLQYVSIVINEGGNYSYLSGATVSYTAGTGNQDIIITATYYYYVAGYTVSTVAPIVVQKQAASPPPSGLTLVPSYTATQTGDTAYTDVNWVILNDDTNTTGVAAGTYYSGSGPCYINVDLGSPLLIKEIRLAGGYLGGSWGDNLAQYLNGGTLEYSSDNTSWIVFATIAGVTDTQGELKAYSPNLSARYWRLKRTTWIATSEFKFYT